MTAHNIHELAAYRLCEELMNLMIEKTATDRISSKRSFYDQLNDAALDAASDVAEGFVRFYPKEFARFLDYALSSLEEVRTRTEAAYKQKLFSINSTSDILNRCARADRACRNLRAYLWTVKKEDLPPRPHRERPKLPTRRRPRKKRPEDDSM